MSIANFQVEGFIPEWWSADLLRSKEKTLVFGGLCNRSYEGQIKQAGDRVRINQVGDITVNSYTKNSTAALTIQKLDDAQISLDIDQAKYFSFQVDDIDEVQANVDFRAEAMRKAGYRLNDTMDQYLFGLHTQAGIQVTSTTTSSTTVEIAFLNLAERLNDANAPSDGRFALIPPWVLTKLTLARILKDTDNSRIYTAGALEDKKYYGYVGRAHGFDFYVSNNVSKVASSNAKIIAGIVGESFTLAEQILKMEAYRMTDEGFGSVVKGLHVYGAKCVHPAITACLTATYTAG